METQTYALQIAYNVLHDAEADDYEIFIMNLDGTEKKNISNWKGVDWVYRAFEDKIYFVSDRDTSHRKYFLYEMDADGGNVRRISHFLVEDSWMGVRKGGEEFAVSSNKDGKRHELYLIDRDGNELKRLTDNDYPDADPCFSPDGRQIVFRSKRGELDELWIMDDDGAEPRQLTHYPADDTTAGRHEYHAGPPFWEPNWNFISYMSKQKGNYSIFTIDPDGKNPRQLTPDGFDEGYHAWSPDGRLVVFDGTPLDKVNYDIYLMNADGSDIRRLTMDTSYEQGPVFVKKFRGR